MIPMVCQQYGADFRTIDKVQEAFDRHPLPDEAICAVLWEYKDRGQKGYDLTERFFDLFSESFPKLAIEGPKRAGSDIQLQSIFPDYPNTTRPVDFVVRDSDGAPIAVGFVRYDSDRGDSQEDDRTGGYANCAKEILEYDTIKRRGLKVIYVNDGPGLLLGSMWDDYAKLESMNPQRILVLTLRMFKDRLTKNWLLKNRISSWPLELFLFDKKCHNWISLVIPKSVLGRPYAIKMKASGGFTMPITWMYCIICLMMLMSAEK